MPTPFVKSPLGGNLGARTASFFRLDPTGTVPIEPIADLVPAFTSNRVTFDVVDSEEEEQSYLVTTHALQDFSSAQNNIHRNLKRINLQGTLISGINIPLVGSAGLGGIPGFGGGLRFDLIRYKNLETLAARREPIMVVTPRGDMPKAFIESLSRSWNPDLGDNSLVSISLVEARIVNPLQSDAIIPDVLNSFTGNNGVTNVGSQPANPVDTQSVQQGEAFGVAPTVIPR